MTISPLRINCVCRRFGRSVAVKDVSFSVEPGEIFGLLGPNGAGKTTLISMIAGLLAPSSGQISIFGHDVQTDAICAKWNVGCVPQELVSHGFFSVEEILNIHSSYYGLLKNKDRIEELLIDLALYDQRKKSIKDLSGGMKRRLLIAKALVHAPKLLLLDEPTAGVDVELRCRLWDYVQKLRDRGCSILLTTHYLQEAQTLCDRVAFINGGEIVQMGKTRAIIHELTARTVCLIFKNSAPQLQDPHILRQEGHLLYVRLPWGQGLGELLSRLRIDLNDIHDITIDEGDLEDAFQTVLRGVK